MNTKPLLSEVEWIGTINYFPSDYYESTTKGVYPPFFWREKMQNEPNFRFSATQITMGHTSWLLCLFNPFLQNEPNFKQRAEFTRRFCVGKHANGADFTPNFSSKMHQKAHTFAQKCIKKCKKNAFFPTFHSKRTQFPKPSTIEYQESCIENMQNEPNPASTSERQETRDQRRETRDV